MSRQGFSGSVCHSQIDIYTLDGVSRQVGVGVSNVTVKVFYNNSLIAWDLVDGTIVPDSSISSGKVYFNEIPGSPGYYSARFYPNANGYWRIVFGVGMLNYEASVDFDIAKPNPISSSGITASFD